MLKPLTSIVWAGTSANIANIVVTLFVLKLLTSIFFKLTHPLNISAIFVTFIVFHMLIFNVCKLLHDLNISVIDVTFDVFHFDTSISTNASQL